MPLRHLLTAGFVLAFSATAAAQTDEERKPPPVGSFTSPTLTRFESEEEFRRYIQAVEAAQERNEDEWGEARRRFLFAQAQTDVQSTESAEPLCEDPELCPEAETQADNDSGSIMVTGARASTPTNPSITNTQMSGVDEGDIVKQIGQFLIVLQDGRLFVIDTRPGGGAGLALVDRTNVYRSPRDFAWYDEMLVQGDRVVVTAYSYGEGASEVSIFRLDPSGRLSAEGVFLISSDDYYSGTNYATRLVGDSLVVYTPYGIGRWEGSMSWPTVRRWLPEDSREAALRRGARLFDAPRIHRPVRDTIFPEIHTVSVCPLGPVGAGRDLACRSTAFVGPSQGQLYVTGEHAYVWTTQSPWQSSGRRRRCAVNAAEAHRDVEPATLFRVAIDDGDLDVLGGRGVPIDQFSFEANDTRFRGLLRQPPARCIPSYRAEPSLAFLNTPLARFGDTLREAPEDEYTPMPPTDTHAIANRFTDRYLVYGSLTSDRFDPDVGELRVVMPRTFAVPVERPAGVRRIAVPHNVLRAERAGNDIVLTGYRDRSGLRVTLVDLDRAPRIASTALLSNRYESEGRSHAFNSLMEADGSGIMGIPTVFYDSSRPVWRSNASDVSYLTADSGGELRPVGELVSGSDQAHPTYRCEVSCIDWYGNSRPIFTDGRIFGLTGTEIVEGRIESGRIRELRRLDMTAPPPRP